MAKVQLYLSVILAFSLGNSNLLLVLSLSIVTPESLD